MKHCIFITLIIALILSACQPALESTPASANGQTQMPPTSTPTPQVVDPLIISPHNVDRLQVVDRWGMGNIYGADLSPDEKTLAVATNIGVYLFNANTLNLNYFIDRSIPSNINVNFPSRPVSFSPDGNVLAIATGDILLWNIPENSIEKNIYHGNTNCKIDELGFDPTGNSIATISTGSCGNICDGRSGNFTLYDRYTGEILYEELFCSDYSKYFFEFLEDEEVIFSGISMKGIHASFIDTQTGKLIKQLVVNEPVYSVRSDGSILSTSSSYDEVSKIIDIETNQVVDQVEALVLYIPGDNQHHIQITENSWTLQDKDHTTLCTFENPPNLSYRLTYRPIFHFSGDNFIYWNGPISGISIWDLSTCQIKNQLSVKTLHNSVDFRANGEYLITGNTYFKNPLYDNTINFYNASNENINYSKFTNFDVSADGKRVVSFARENLNELTLWDISSGEIIASTPLGVAYFDEIYLNSKGNIAATGRWGDYQLWNLEKGSLIADISGYSSNFFFSPDGDSFAVLEDYRLMFRDALTGDYIRKINFSGKASTIFFSNDWQYFIHSIKDKIELWTVEGTKIRTMDNYSYVIFDTSEESLDKSLKNQMILTRSMIFSPNNDLLIALQSDLYTYNIRFWNTKTGKIIRDIRIEEEVSDIAITPDGKDLLLLINGVIYVWEIVKK